MKFSELSQYLEKLERVSSRLTITEILSDLFKITDVKEIDKVVYLILGGLAARHENIVFNLSDKLIIRAVSEAYSADAKNIRECYKQIGDLGLVAESLPNKLQATSYKLSVNEVYENLKIIALDEGEGSVERKITGVANLLKKLDPLSSRFVVRIPIGKLRLGFSDKTILDALSWMEAGDKSSKKDLEAAYQVLPDVGLLAKNVKEQGIKKATKNIKPITGTPVLPMLAQRLKSPVEMIKKMGKVSIEPKFDGLRIQIHYKKGQFTKAYTRNLNETSWMFPELVNIKKQIKADSVILDCEAVGLSEDAKKMVNFQVTMTRRRKHDVDVHSNKTPIRFQIFDILEKNGQSLLSEPYLKRREILDKTLNKGPLLVVDNYLITDNHEIITREHTVWLAKGLEGIIVKAIDSRYVPGRTGWRWVKMKEVESAAGKLADTVDCVVMGYSRGRGKRAQFGIGQFLAGIRDGEIIKTITKVGTGLTDAQFKELKKRLTPLEINQKPVGYEVDKNLEPDFWVKPALVVELAADEITISPIHTAGYALRFPRLIQFREDKSLKEVTSVNEIRELHALQ